MKRKIQILMVYLVLVIGFIWGQSLLPAKQSSKESSRVLENVVHPVEKALTGKETITEFQVRKAAHVLEFTALGFGLCLFALCLRENHPGDSGLLWVLRGVGTGMFVAFLDETIQIFTGRGPQIQDVWIDTSGVLLGTTAALIMTALLRRLFPSETGKQSKIQPDTVK